MTIELAFCAPGVEDTTGTPMKYSRPDFGNRNMSFGYTKKNVSEVEPNDLRLVLSWIRNNSDAPTFRIQVAEKIENFLAQ